MAEIVVRRTPSRVIRFFECPGCGSTLKDTFREDEIDCPAIALTSCCPECDKGVFVLVGEMREKA